MPTRKQRRRRDKTFRHEYETVLIDSDGSEVPVSELRTRDEPKERERAKGKSAAKPATTGRGRSRPLREVPPPSWQRSVRRGGLWGLAMLVVVLIFFKNTSLPVRVAWGVFYALAFIPLTYFVDRTAYRTYLRRKAASEGDKKK
jgi:hypothetical protein